MPRYTKQETLLIALIFSFISACSLTHIFRINTLNRSFDVSKYTPEYVTKTKEKININTADTATLARLSGIGAVISERIVRYRKGKGAFSVKSEIMKIKGIGPEIYKRIEKDICVQ